MSDKLLISNDYLIRLAGKPAFNRGMGYFKNGHVLGLKQKGSRITAVKIMADHLSEMAEQLPADERALVAHCLITSLESKQDDETDEGWAELAEKRYLELESGAVKGVSWQQIKNEVTGQDA